MFIITRATSYDQGQTLGSDFVGIYDSLEKAQTGLKEALASYTDVWDEGTFESELIGDNIAEFSSKNGDYRVSMEVFEILGR